MGFPPDLCEHCPGMTNNGTILEKWEFFYLRHVQEKVKIIIIFGENDTPLRRIVLLTG